MKVSLSWLNGKRGKRTFSCQNPACKKDFATPLKTLDLQQEPAEPYPACPFCLTKITDGQVEISSNPKITQVEPVIIKEKLVKGKEKTSDCEFHLGYLSEREKNQQISDKCIMCKDIVECMLKKMRT